MTPQSDFQPLAGEVQAEISRALDAIDPAAVEDLIQAALKADRIFVAGKGRTGLQMQAFAMRLIHLGMEAHIIGEMTTPGIRTGDLLIIGSASGRTGSLAAFANFAKVEKIALAAITANQESEIARLADVHVYIPAPSHKKQDAAELKSVLPLGGLFESALGVALNVFVLRLMEALGVTEEEMAARHANLE